MAAECRTCHAEIDWAVKYPEEINPKTSKPKSMPIDHGSADDPAGNIAVWRVGPLLRFRYLTKTAAELRPGEHKGISHYSTCPDRKQHQAGNHWPEGSHGEAAN